MGEMLSNFQVTKAEIKSRMTTISGLNWIKHLEVTCLERRNFSLSLIIEKRLDSCLTGPSSNLQEI